MMELKKRVLVKLEEMNGYLNDLEEILPNNKKTFIVSHRKLGIPQSEDDLINILEKKKIFTTNERLNQIV